MSVVICEDNRKDQFELRRILESGHIPVLETFNHGRDLMNWLEANPGKAQIVLLDIIMPVLDGYAAFCEIQAKKLSVQVIFVTVENSRDVIRSLVDKGAAQYITKPLDRDSVIQKIRQVLAKK
ncbi:MAG: response regulator [Leptospiraceae bacterium]|nr:response regulator [Leptospiraceae bacterium]